MLVQQWPKLVCLAGQISAASEPRFNPGETHLATICSEHSRQDRSGACR